MYLLSMLAGLVLSGCIIVGTYRTLARGAFGRAWHIACAVLTCAGLALGCWLVSITYLASPTSKVYGAPFCIAGADFIDGRWLAGGVGRYMPLPLLADIGLGVAVCLLPAAGLLIFRRRQAVRPVGRVEV